MASLQKVSFLRREALLISLLFFLIGLGTLPDYGVNWDSINHLPRGQSYLHYFLTGSKNFQDEPPFQKYWQDERNLFFKPLSSDTNVTSTSLYENAGVDYTYFVTHDGGHPPLGGILASVTNTIFFKKLMLINDIDAYRIAGLLMAAALVGVVYYWSVFEFGRIAGLVAAISISSYPLFWAESHFNTEKDVPLSFLWFLTLFVFYKVIKTKSIKWILMCGLTTGMALSVKFNTLFLPFVILPTFIYQTAIEKRIQLGFWIKLLIIPIIAISFFILIWPYLWADPLTRIQTVIAYYKEIGTTTNFDKRFITILGFNSYPLIWIIYTTPILTLVLSIIGLLLSLLRFFKSKRVVYLLIVTAFVFPILRVSVPHSNIYGGVRQIMEFIPPMAMLAGIAAQEIYKHLKTNINKIAISIFIVLGYFGLIVTLYKIHPAENAYFNIIAGGLSGAKQKDIPSWGNTFGGIYRVGATWLNNNAEPNSNIAYARELIPNIPRVWLRKDFVLFNQNRSGTLMKGEYVIALTYEGVEKTSYWDRYLAKFLTPVFVHKVDDVPVLTIWKNSPEYLNKKFAKTYPINTVKASTFDQGIIIDMGKVVNLAEIKFDFTQKNCNKDLFYAYAQISTDNLNWERLPGMMPKEDWSVPMYGTYPNANHVMIPFAADRARYIEVVIAPQDSCMKNVINVSGRRYED